MHRKSSFRNSYYKRFLNYNIKKNALYLILGIAFLVGIFFGSEIITAASGRTKDMLISILGLKTNITGQTAFNGAVASAFLSQIMLLVIIFVMGLCAIGQPFIVLVLIYQGLGFGFIASYCYGIGSRAEIAYLLLVVTPRMLISVILLIIAAGESLKMSTHFTKLAFTEQRSQSPDSSMRLYIARYIALVIGTAVYSALYGVIEYIYKIV